MIILCMDHNGSWSVPNLPSTVTGLNFLTTTP